METKHTHFHDHILSYVLIFLIVTVGVFSYYRFMVKHDYVVGYQGVCDPATGKCFMSCEDDACTKIDYYSNMLKYEPDLHKECGNDISNCDAASVCLPGDRKCSISYCNREIDGDICQNDNVGDTNI